MRAHLHRGPWRETLRAGTWAVPETDTATAHVVGGRVVERRRTCTRCGATTVITERDGRRWRRQLPPTRFDADAPSWVGE